MEISQRLVQWVGSGPKILAGLCTDSGAEPRGRLQRMAEMAPKLAVTTIPLREVQSYIPHRRQRFHLGDMTMKVLCISKWAKAPSPEERAAILPKEVPAPRPGESG